ncbi:ribosomal-processing cysteine protease Prp [Bacillus fonticola]|uniref:ribosomal-processing cysteine protease Prp n=1 Tax=Bacillus fonticola TaxID=2728853 RepID=UPI00147358CA|nr:ribosomal-processing cysteine protease Prp [Bacillus fonticola]
MIAVTVQQRDNRIHSLTLEGHAGFAKHGEDLVCAGVSAVIFGGINAVEELLSVSLQVEQRPNESGYIRADVPAGLPVDKEANVELLLRSIISSLRTIERDYGKYVSIKISK